MYIIYNTYTHKWGNNWIWSSLGVSTIYSAWGFRLDYPRCRNLWPFWPSTSPLDHPWFTVVLSWVYPGLYISGQGNSSVLSISKLVEGCLKMLKWNSTGTPGGLSFVCKEKDSEVDSKERQCPQNRTTARHHGDGVFMWCDDADPSSLSHRCL